VAAFSLFTITSSLVGF